jgi:hypothetical protein
MEMSRLAKDSASKIDVLRDTVLNSHSKAREHNSNETIILSQSTKVRRGPLYVPASTSPRDCVEIMARQIIIAAYSFRFSTKCRVRYMQRLVVGPETRISRRFHTVPIRKTLLEYLDHGHKKF